MEANPLVVVFGLGWGTLIGVNVVMFVPVVMAAYYAFVKYCCGRSQLACNGFMQYCSMLYYNRTDKFSWVMYKMSYSLPTNRAPLLALSCFLFVVIFIAVRLVAVFGWITIIVAGVHPGNWHLPEYHSSVLYWVISAHLPVNPFALVIAFTFLFANFYWHLNEYRLNKKMESEMTKIEGI